MTRYDVAIIGLGAMGSAALYHLARRGRRVVGIERAAPGHEGGSSHGESRIIRLAQFENPAYTPLVRRAYAHWETLEREGGEAVIVPTGMIEGGLPGSPIVEGSLRAARGNSLAHEVLTPKAANARFPALDLPPGWTVVYQPGAGIVRADVAIRLLVAGARAAGAEVRERTTVAAIEPAERGVRIGVLEGDVIEADRVIVTAGAWTGELVPELAPLLQLTRQAVGWFEPARPAEAGPDRLPIFMFEDEDEAIYGFPDFAGGGVKAASHRLGRTLARASDARQDAAAEDLSAVAQLMARRIPGAAGPLKTLKTCIYASTPDEEFVIDRHPRWPQIVLCSACSGHGFKFASLFGEVLADMAETGAVPAEMARFGLARFGIG